MSNLIWLWLHGNRLSGPIPSVLGNLADLRQLWLDGNRLSGPIGVELGNLSSLRWLRLDSDTGLCLVSDFPLDTEFGRRAQALGLTVCAVVSALPAPAVGLLSALLAAGGAAWIRRRGDRLRA